MSSFILHLGATVICAHGGQASPAAPDSRVLVDNQPVVTLTGPYTVAGCPFVSGTNPLPCVTGQWTSAATRVTASGQPLVIATSSSVCTPNGTPMNIIVTQVRVSAQ